MHSSNAFDGMGALYGRAAFNMRCLWERGKKNIFHVSHKIRQAMSENINIPKPKLFKQNPETCVPLFQGARTQEIRTNCVWRFRGIADLSNVRIITITKLSEMINRKLFKRLMDETLHHFKSITSATPGSPSHPLALTLYTCPLAQSTSA